MPPKARHRVLVGVNYPTRGGGEARHEPGDIVDDIPADTAAAWLADRIIEEAR